MKDNHFTQKKKSALTFLRTFSTNTDKVLEGRFPPSCESCSIRRASRRFLSTLDCEVILPIDSTSRETDSLKSVFLSHRRHMYSTSNSFFLITPASWEFTAHSKWAAWLHMPAPVIGLFRHRMISISSVSGVKALQQRMHLHSRQNPGSEQHIWQTNVSAAPVTLLFPVSRWQCGLPARHLFFGLWQLLSPAWGDILSLFVWGTFGARQTNHNILWGNMHKGN